MPIGRNSYTRKDVRDLFPRIGRQTAMLYSEGSVEVKMGRYVEEKDVRAGLDRLKGYRFV